MDSLLKIQEKLATGGMAKGEALSLKTSSLAAVSYLISSHRGSISVGSMLQENFLDEHFADQLEKLRMLINTKNIFEAKNYLEKMKPKNDWEKSELYLEEARLLASNGELVEVCGLVTKALELETISPITRLTLKEVKGYSLMKLKKYDEALNILGEAKKVALSYPHLPSSYQASSCLVHIYAELKKPESCLSEISEMSKKLLLIKNKEEWISRFVTFKRGVVGYNRYYGNDDEIYKTLIEVKAISKWLGREDTFQKTCDDLKAVKIGPQCEFKFSNWSYLSDSSIVLFADRTTYFNIQNNPTLTKVLELLVKGPMKTSDLLKQVWSLDVVNENYDAHIRACLSKLRKFLPTNSLFVKEGVIYLR